MKYLETVKEIQKHRREGLDFWTSALQKTSAYMLALLIKTPVTPNHLTITSFIIAAISCMFIIREQMILAALFIHIGYLFDCGDGQYARYKKIFSPFGPWLDSFLDRLKEFIMAVALTTVYIKTNPNAFYWGLYMLLLTTMYHGQEVKKLPSSTDSSDGIINNEEIISLELKNSFIYRLNSLRNKIGSSPFNGGEQILIISFFLIIERIDLLFYVFTGYGSLVIFLYPFYKLSKTRMLLKGN